jgi:hypothetical protein
VLMAGKRVLAKIFQRNDFLSEDQSIFDRSISLFSLVYVNGVSVCVTLGFEIQLSDSVSMEHQ